MSIQASFALRALKPDVIGFSETVPEGVFPSRDR